MESINLSNYLIYYILNNFHVDNPNFINSLYNERFLTNKKISFEDEDGALKEINIYGLTFSLQDVNIHALSANISSETESTFYISLLYDKVSYGLMFTTSLLDESLEDKQTNFSAKTADSWAACSVARQCQVVAGLEQIKDLHFDISKIDNEELSSDLINYIKYCEDLWEEKQQQ